jgi:hypothetical protein
VMSNWNGMHPVREAGLIMISAESLDPNPSDQWLH